MARETIAQLKKIFQKNYRELKTHIWLKCADCQGFFVDGYQPCSNKKCSLRGFYPSQKTVKSPAFNNQMISQAKEKYNDPELVTKISQISEKKKKLPNKKTH